MFIESKGKTVEELVVEISTLYRRLLHDTPSFHFKQNYKGTPESVKAIRKNHDYTVEVGMFKNTEKGDSAFTVMKSFTDSSFEKAMGKLVADINADW